MTPQELIPVGFQILSRVSPRFAGKLAKRLFLTPRRIPRPDWEKPIWEKGSEIRFTSGRVGRTFGERKDRPWIAVIHGWEGRGSQFGHFFQPLVEQGYCVLAWDGPAHGESPGKRTHMVNFSKALREDFSELPSPIFALVGHSFGGGTSILVHSMGFSCQKIAVIAAPSRIQAVFDRFSSWIRLSPQAAEYFQNYTEDEVGISVKEADLIDFARSCKTPGLIIHDEGDSEVPCQESVELHQAWKNSTHLLTHNLGHRRILKSPQVIQSLVEFLQKT